MTTCATPPLHRPGTCRAVAMALVLLGGAVGCDTKAELPAYKGKAKPTDPAAIGNKAGSKATGQFDADAPTKPAAAISPAALLARARPLLGALPAQADNPANPITAAKVELGRVLYFDPRLSKNQQISCNTCHVLTHYGVDTRERNGARAPTSEGHGGQLGERNTPTVFNAGFHIAQFWDGRAKDIEQQAMMPILNPVEMAMDDEAAVIAVLRSIPGYAPLFAAAFPDDREPISVANLASAVGAYERKLVTPAAFDRFMAGDAMALDEAQLQGLQLFLDVGCTQCHAGPALGGTQFQKLGSVKPWPEQKDEGRAAHTKSPLDRFVFKVPSLRNVVETGPWLHDGSFTDLGAIVGKMAEHQSARGKLTPAETAAIVAFLGALTGELPRELITTPVLPESGPDTPKAAAI